MPKAPRERKTYPQGIGTPKGSAARLAFKMSKPVNSHKAKSKQKVQRPAFAKPGVLPFESTLAFAFRGAGGKQIAIEAARLLSNKDPRFLKIVTAFDTLSLHDQEEVRLEDLCTGAEISSGDFLRDVIPALWERNVDIARIIAAVSQPKVVQDAVNASGTPFGGADRKMMLEIGGIYTPKGGMSINIDNSKKTLNVHEAQALSGLPTFESEGIESVGVIRGDHSSTKALPPASPRQFVKVPTGEVLEAELVQSEDQ